MKKTIVSRPSQASSHCQLSHSHSISEPATLFPLLPTWARRTRMHRYRRRGPPEENMFGIVTDTDL